MYCWTDNTKRHVLHRKAVNEPLVRRSTVVKSQRLKFYLLVRTYFVKETNFESYDAISKYLSVFDLDKNDGGKTK